MCVCVCVQPQKERNICSFLLLLPRLFVEAPHHLHALPYQTVLNFLSQLHINLCNSVSGIMGSLMLAMTSH